MIRFTINMFGPVVLQVGSLEVKIDRQKVSAKARVASHNPPPISRPMLSTTATMRAAAARGIAARSAVRATASKRYAHALAAAATARPASAAAAAGRAVRHSGQTRSSQGSTAHSLGGWRAG